MTSQKLVLYVDPLWRRDGIHSPLMNPWWGNLLTETSLFAKEMLDSYQFDTSSYTVTDNIADAHMVFPPYKHQWLTRHNVALWEECVATAKKAELPLFVDGTSDVEPPLGVTNAWVLRIGGFTYINEPGAIQVPPLVDDLLERCEKGVFTPRAKREGEKPVVSFSGWASLTLKQTIRTMLKEAPQRLRSIVDRKYITMTKGVFWRAKAIKVLQNSSAVEMKLKVRATFSGSAKTAGGDLRTLQREFVDGILASDYGLEVRGDPNTSARLFEICALGRIPVVLDTERNFPWSDELNYKEFCLIVNYKDLPRMPEIIADFHKNISPEKFEAMQRRAREVFVHYFRLDALMPHIVRALQNAGALKA